MFYNNTRLTVVQKITYLGVTLSYNGLFYQAQKALANQSLKSLFALNSIFDTVALETSDKIKLFDSLVATILNYSSEVWGFHDANYVENIHLDILKRIVYGDEHLCFGDENTTVCESVSPITSNI